MHMFPCSCDAVNPEVLLTVWADLGEIEVTVHNCMKKVRGFKKCYGPFGSSEVSDAYGTWGTGTARVSICVGPIDIGLSILSQFYST